jgi:hypothetical protein
MPLVDTSNPSANWYHVLALWSRIANWTAYKPNDRDLSHDILAFAVALWSERDWLIAEYPSKKAEIDAFMAATESLSIVADLANTTKHRALTRKRWSTAEQTHFRGRVSVTGGASRQLHYLQLQDGRTVEIMAVLRKALDNLESFRIKLRVITTVDGAS